MFHVKLKLEVSLEGLSGQQFDLLARFEGLLADRAVPLGLIARADRGRIRERHVLDSLRARACLDSADEVILDIGSGAGLPGIPLAIAEPERRLILVEPRNRRAAFLEFAVDELGLSNVDVLPIRAQELQASVRLCTARAVASLERTWGLANPLLSEGGRVLYFAGASWEPPALAQWAESGGSWEVFLPGQFPWQGPLVIIRRSQPGGEGHGHRPRS